MTDDAARETLARLRRGTRRAGAGQVREELAELPRLPAARLPADSLPLAFLVNLLRAGGSAAVCSSRRDAVDSIGEFIAARHGQRRLVVGHDPRLAALPWRDGGLLPRFGSAEDGDTVALSCARAAIAETGSTLLALDRDNPATNNLLAQDHLVLVEASCLVATLEEGWRRAAMDDPATRPRGLMMITGPSSTADIALKMVKGAHGPLCFHVVLMGGELYPGMLDEAQALLAAGTG
jgi:L-lactate dehydrogenase complex protein LldG